MVRSIVNELWVTYLSPTEQSVKAGLNLLASIRCSMSTKSILALIHPDMDRTLKFLVVKSFDRTMTLNFEGGLDDDEAMKIYAKIFPLSLPGVQKCIFLESESLMVRNADYIFDSFGENEYLFGELSNDDGVIVDCSIIGMNTSSHDYFALMDNCFKNNAKLNDEDILQIIKSGTKHMRTIPLRCSSSEELELEKFPFINQSLPIAQEILEKNTCEQITMMKDLTNGAGGREPIAIVGISCRFPKSNDLDQFWNLILEGKDATSSPPEDRWSLRNTGRILQDKYLSTKGAFISSNVDEFDCGFFHMSPREAELTDPQHRLLLEVCWEALEDASIQPSSLENTSASIFTGIWRQDYRDLTLSQDKKPLISHEYKGNSFAASSGRLAHFFRTTGPTGAIEAGCSSSMIAVGQAMDSLRKRESNIAFATGVNLLLRPFVGDEFPLIWSPDGCCKSFQAEANGYGRGEGVAALVLKRLSDAVRDDNRIYALLRGYGASQEGLSNSMGTPTPEGQAMAMRNALEDANLEAGQVQYIEAHGTGTVVGDAVEMAGIRSVYSSNDRSHTPQGGLFISSVKSNIGHTESVSGLAGIIKAAMSLHYKIIPPHQFSSSESQLSPQTTAELNEMKGQIPKEPIPWISEGTMRVAAVSNFGLTGSNAHVILTEAPPSNMTMDQGCGQQRCQWVLPISAKNDSALRSLLEKVKSHLEGNNMELKNVAGTLSLGRDHMSQVRAVLVGPNRDELTTILPGCRTGASICFLFTGQGSQYPGMGRQLYETAPIFKRAFDECDIFLKEEFNIHIKDVIWSLQEDNGNGGSSLDHSFYSQAAIFVIEYALLRLWDSWGISPSIVVGHSVGEFAASVAAGHLALKEALILVGNRCQLLNQLPEGRMLVLRVPMESAKDHMEIFLRKAKSNESEEDNWLDIAAMNGPSQIVVAGPTKTIQEFQIYCKNNGITSILLKASHAYHTRHMGFILKQYQSICEDLFQRKNSSSGVKDGVQYISGVTGQPMTSLPLNYWPDHLSLPVNFELAASKVLEQNELDPTIFLEIGPHPTLLNLLKENSLKKNQLTLLPSLQRGLDPWTTLSQSVANFYIQGHEINWKEFYKGVRFQKVSLPHYPFQGTRHWFPISTPNPRRTIDSLVHPLLGYRVDAPGPNGAVYRNELRLNDLPYLRDHCVFDKIVFPGAGFIDMFLAMAVAEGNGHEVKLKDVTFLTPLFMEEGEITTLQTILNEQREISIYSRDETQEWKLHARATIIQEKEDNELILEEISDGNNEIINIEDMYRKMFLLGYDFGKSFQSLHDVEKNNNELIAHVIQRKNESGGRIHPITLDAMLQAVLIHSRPSLQNLEVPHMAHRIIFHGNPPKTCEKYRIVSHLNEDGGHVSLLDHENRLILSIKGLKTVAVSSASFGGHSHGIRVPPMYVEEWIEADEEVLRLKDISTDMDENMKTFGQHDSPSEEEMEERHLLNKMIGVEIFNAFNSMGVFEESVVFDMDTFMVDVKGHLHHVIKRLLGFIKEDGYLNDEFIPSKLALNAPSKIPGTPLKRFSSELKLVRHVLEHFKGIILGKVSPLQVLFSKGNDAISAESYYRESSIYAQLNKGVRNVFSMLLSILEKSNGGNIPLRILEVGGGTAASSLIVLKILQEHSIPFHYDFTDLSHGFFTQADAKLRPFMSPKNGSRLDFGVLDLETWIPSAPGELGGFQTYDIILGANVLHATEDLGATMGRLLPLLKANGLMVIAETLIPQRYLDASFGFFEGYWNFKDERTVKGHCVLNVEEWTSLLYSRGYKNVKAVTTSLETGIIVAQAGKFDVDDSSSMSVRVRMGANDEKSYLLVNMLGDGKMLHDMEATLNSLGRSTICVKGSSEFRMDDEGRCCWMSPTNEDHYGKLYNWLLDSKHLENILGVAYLDLYQVHEDNKEECSIGLRRGEAYYKFCHFILSKLSYQSSSKKLQLNLVTKRAVSCSPEEIIEDPTGNLLWGMTRSMSNEMKGISFRSIDLHHEEKTFVPIIIKEMLQSVENKEHLIAFRQHGDEGRKYVARLRKQTSLRHEKELVLPTFDTSANSKLELVLPPSRELKDITFIQKSMGSSTELLPTEVEVSVCAVGLNYKDLLIIRRVNDSINSMLPFGIANDYSGVITAVGSSVLRVSVGQAVYGVNLRPFQYLSNKYILDEKDTWPLPDNWTFEAGVTLPCAFGSAYLALITLANLKKNEWVLIHTASGGFGLAAVQIAKQLGANIIATAGNQRKREYLRSVIGLKHVFNSRDVGFKRDILELLPQGVNVAVNTVTGPGLKEATLDCCGLGARFMEMSKLGIWSQEEVKGLRDDVIYEIVDAREDLVQGVLKHLNDGIMAGWVKPLPRISFCLKNLHNAMEYLKSAKHIGKVVVTIPKRKLVKVNLMGHLGLGLRGQSSESEEISLRWASRLFSDRVSYIITGGLGGLGLEVAKWMVERGAKYIVLAQRAHAKEKGVLKTIYDLRVQRARVEIIQCDVDIEEEVRGMINKTKNLKGWPKLIGGIFHLAGWLRDGLVQTQKWSSAKAPLLTKMQGAWNLHYLTLNEPLLEHFVLFSSFSAIVGIKGQSNHAGGNAAMDSLAQYRWSLGMPAMSLNWGQWGSVGSVGNRVLKGMTPFTPNEGINALELATRYHATSLIITKGETQQWLKEWQWMGSYVSKLLEGHNKSSDDVHQMTISDKERQPSNKNNMATDFMTQCMTQDSRGKSVLIENKLVEIVGSVLHMKEDVLKENRKIPLLSLGLDSLMKIELENNLAVILKSKANHHQHGDGFYVDEKDSLECLVSKVLELLKDSIGSSKDTSMEGKGRGDWASGLDNLIHEDCILDDDIRPKGGACCLNNSLLETILLTGSTGNMGPYVLNELAKRSELSRIICLVRSRRGQSGRSRIEASLSKSQLNQEEHEGIWKKVDVLEGDVGLDKFDSEEGAYDALALEVDAIVHVAVHSSHLEDYTRDSILRRVNVIGTKNVLRFAVDGRPKRIYFASSIVATLEGSEGRLKEQLAGEGEWDNGPRAGYGVSKFIGERLMAEAQERGINVTVFRFPLIFGHSHNGRQNVPENHWLMRYLTYLKNGIFPPIQFPVQMLPVDICAIISISLFLDHELPSSGIYNIMNRNCSKEEELIPLLCQRLGLPPPKSVTFKEFIDEQLNLGSKSLIRPFLPFYVDEERYLMFEEKMTMIKEWNMTTNDYFRSDALAPFEGMMENPLDILERDVRFVMRTMPHFTPPLCP